MNKTLERIEELRNRHKYSVNQMCKNIGIPQSTYATWLKDDREPKPKYVRSVAEHFNKPISYFYDDEENKKPAVISELSEAKRELINFVNSLQEDAAESMLRIMKVYYEEWQRNQR